MCLVPSDSEYSFPSVRSTCAPRNSRLASRMMATNSTPMTVSPAAFRLVFLSMRLPGFDRLEHGGAREQEEDGNQREVQDIAHVEHTFDDVLEVPEERQREYAVDQPLRRPALEPGRGHGVAGEQQHEADQRGDQ